MEKIKIENLTFTYPGEKKPAICDINLEISSGEFVTVCGKSGCGKSTLLRSLKPSVSPYGARSGRVYLDGEDLFLMSQRSEVSRVGFVSQSVEEQIVTDRVWHELAFGLENLGFENSEIRLCTAEMASFFGIGEYFDKKTDELSGGQKQILALASVMVTKPSVLILDEPTSRLDPIAAQKFLEAVGKLNRELGITVIISEHRLSEVMPISDRVIVMEKGRVAFDAPPKELCELLNKTQNDMFFALPTPARAFFSKESGGVAPLTVREGREWLLSEDIKEKSFFEKDVNGGERVISVSKVFFRYDKTLPDVLNGFSLDLKRGELYALLGGNGEGKTTALSLLAGINKPYSGKIGRKDGLKVCLLSQNPRDLFVKSTVEEELFDALCDRESGEDAKKTVFDMLCFFGLTKLSARHPYDLSGGEAEKLAIAKVLLRKPDVLLLDEPTKGLDAHFKEELAELFGSLCARGIAILMVTHDIEFSARYADRCGMLFGGEIISEGAPREFFSEKSFYTTEAARMSQGILDGAILCEDIVSAIGGKEISRSHQFSSDDDNTYDGGGEDSFPKAKEKHKKISARAVVSAVVTLFLVPLTVFLGHMFLNSRKYYFISLLVILETLVPFFVVFEDRRREAKELALLAVMCALAVAGRVAFEFLPQFKPVSALVIISGLAFGPASGFLVGAMSMFVSNFFFGQTPFSPWQMLSFGLIGFFSGLLSKTGIEKKKIALSLFGFFATFIIYGGIMNPASVLLGQANPTSEMFLTAYATGLTFDMVHAAATAIFLFLIARPLGEKLERVKKKYEIEK